jgi:hypothetical protein
LSSAGQITEAIKLRRKRTKRLIPRFIQLFWLLLLFVLIDASYGVYTANLTDTKNRLKADVQFDYGINAGVEYGAILSDNLVEKVCFADDRDCSDWLYLEWVEDTSPQKSLLHSYNELIDGLAKSAPIWLKCIILLEYVTTLVIVGIPLSAALLISFNLTIWTLSKITYSSLRLFVVFIFDIIIAVLLPPLILTIVIYVIVLLAVYTLGGLVDYFTFDHSSIFNLIVGGIWLSITASLPLPMILSWILYNNFFELSFLSEFSVAFSVIVINIIATMRELVVDIWKFVHLDFRVSLVASAINWAIVTDLTYSIYFIVPSIILVTVQRSSFWRRTFLSLVLWIADHPKGAIHAVAEIMMGWLTMITKLVGLK